MKTRPFFEGQLFWNVSWRWTTRRHDCTLAGIVARCHGHCCTSKTLWPPVAYGGVCGLLGPKGCTLSQADRPVICSLYPLRLVKHTLVLHHRTTYAKSCCAGNHGKGPMVIDALKPSLTALFGKDQYDHARADVLQNRNSHFIPSPELLTRLDVEASLANENLPYPKDTKANVG